MGLSCSKCAVVVFSGENNGNGNGNGISGGKGGGGRGDRKSTLLSANNKKSKNKTLQCSRQDSPDPVVYDLTRRSVAFSQQRERDTDISTSKVGGVGVSKDPHVLDMDMDINPANAVLKPVAAAGQVYPGQHHLLYKQQKGNPNSHAAVIHHNNYNNSKFKNKKPTDRDAAVVTATATAASTTATGATNTESKRPVRDSTTAAGKTTTAATAMPKKLTHVKGKSSNKAKGTLYTQSRSDFPTRVVVRRHSPRHFEEGMSGTHIYCIRYPANIPLDSKGRELPAQAQQEQCPTTSKAQQTTSASQDPSTATTSSPPPPPPVEDTTSTKPNTTIMVPTTADSVNTVGVGSNNPKQTSVTLAAAQVEAMSGELNVDQLFRPSAMAQEPTQSIVDWVTISEEHSIYVADVGLGVTACDEIVAVTEQVCRGQYAAYTYAKQTLGCREFPLLASQCQAAAHTVTHAIVDFADNPDLALDDREPHMVKYDVTKKERQKLDMHTDKSEWTFLIALSNGCGMDYEGGGTYFECLDATLHLQRGHALIFPGKLRHCGQRITAGLRFLLVGFLVDKTGKHISFSNDDNNAPDSGMTALLSSYQ